MEALNSLDPGEPQPGVPVSPEQNALAHRVLAEILRDLGGKPALGDYRRVYATLGLDWPGEQRIRDLVSRRGVIGGKVVDPSSLAAHVGGSFAMATWFAVANEVGIVLYVPVLTADPGRLHRIAPDLDLDLL